LGREVDLGPRWQKRHRHFGAFGPDPPALRSKHFGEIRAYRVRKAKKSAEEEGMHGEGWRLPPVPRELQFLLVHRERPDLLGEKAA